MQLPLDTTNSAVRSAPNLVTISPIVYTQPSTTTFIPNKKRPPIKIVVGVLFALLVSIGLLAGMLLLNSNQDIRQQAYIQQYEFEPNKPVTRPSPTPTPTPKSSPVSKIQESSAPDQLDDRCSISGETVCRFGLIYQCSTPFSNYQKTDTDCGEGTSNPGVTVNCCINNQPTKRELSACQAAGGTVGACPTKERVCVTAFGEIAYGESKEKDEGACNAGVKTIISCSSTGVITSSLSREGCPQPLPSPSPTEPTAPPILLGKCYATSDVCQTATTPHCNEELRYTTQTQCLAALDRLSEENCNPITTNCSNATITIWVPN